MHNIYIGCLICKFFSHFFNMKILFLFNNRDVRFHIHLKQTNFIFYETELKYYN